MSPNTIVRAIQSWMQFILCQRKPTLCNPAFLVKCHMDFVLKLPAAYLNCLLEQTTGLHHPAKKDVLTPPSVSSRASHGLCPETLVYCFTRYKHIRIFQGRCSLHHPQFLLDLHSYFVYNVFLTCRNCLPKQKLISRLSAAENCWVGYSRHKLAFM